LLPKERGALALLWTEKRRVASPAADGLTLRLCTTLPRRVGLTEKLAVCKVEGGCRCGRDSMTSTPSSSRKACPVHTTERRLRRGCNASAWSRSRSSAAKLAAAAATALEVHRLPGRGVR
jgi:hypothetical protein